MKKYICVVCGYIYDEALGDPANGIAPGTKWSELLDDWECPVCGASKDEFEEMTENDVTILEKKISPQDDDHDLRKMSLGEMSALFSNLAKGCEKQYLMEEAERFNQLSQYYKGISEPAQKAQYSDIKRLVQKNLDEDFAKAKAVVTEKSDRGALRALVWGEKVTQILSSALSKYEKQKDDLLKDTNIYVCEICGFVYIGDEPPELCPVCKVPNMKIRKIQKEAI